MHAPTNSQVIVRRLGDANVLVCVSDDGIGIPAGVDIANPNSLGLHLMSRLARQLDGCLQVNSSGGTRIEIRFPA